MPDRARPSRPRAARTVLLAPLALAALLALAGCTGTTETRTPVLLIAASNGATPRLLLIEDTFDTPDLVEERFVVLGVGTSLPAPVVAMEVADPLAGRDPLVVLTRSAAAPFTAELRLFRTAEIDPAAPELEPVDLAPDDPASDALALDPLLSEATGAPVPCPVDMAVVRAPAAGGADDLQVAFLLDPAACGGSGGPSVVAVELPTAEVAWDDVTSLVRAAGIASDAEDGTFAYVVSDAVRLVDAEGEEAATLPLDLDEPLDLAYAGRVLLALEDDAFELAPLDPAEEEADPVVTPAGALRIVEEPFEAHPDVVVLGGDRVRLHATPDDAAPGDVSAPGALWGTVDPFGGFAYVPLAGRLGLLDLLRYDADTRTGRSLSSYWDTFAIPELAAPGPIAWVPAAGTITPEEPR